ncbi:unnamed protein product [Phytophthora fragariaefolia]|uniref:Unnamed protein product n=1 Tax=Phytophthora fragariaefolia TaxID=1490495 RepID=A0A9W6U601_9STRA|nr:unnamed protein product [Phytophthora fragariaefolia]
MDLYAIFAVSLAHGSDLQPSSQNSKMNLMYECCAEMGVIDRLGDLMQRKLREFQAAQVARNVPMSTNASAAAVHPMGSPPRAARKSDLGLSDEGFICGSSNFQDVAAFSSSYKGQLTELQAQLGHKVHLIATVLQNRLVRAGLTMAMQDTAKVRATTST